MPLSSDEDRSPTAGPAGAGPERPSNTTPDAKHSVANRRGAQGDSSQSPVSRRRRWGTRARVHNRFLHRLVNVAWERACVHGSTGPDDLRASGFGAFGSNSCLSFPPGAIFGERWIEVGSDTLIGPYVSISAGMVPGQAMVTNPVVRIGSRCMIGRGSHIVGHFSVDIDDDVHTGPYVYITDQNHGYEAIDEPVHSQWPSDRPVRIGAGSWLGTGAVILPGTELGRNVVVGAGAVVRGSFPDHCVIAGVPAKVVRKFDSATGWSRPTSAD